MSPGSLPSQGSLPDKRKRPPTAAIMIPVMIRNLPMCWTFSFMELTHRGNSLQSPALYPLTGILLLREDATAIFLSVKPELLR